LANYKIKSQITSY